MRATTWTIVGLLVCGCFVDGGKQLSSTSTDPTTAGPTTDPTGTDPTTTDATDTGADATTAPTTTDTTGTAEGQPCDPFAQDCPDDFKCAPYASDGGPVWDANKCVPVTGEHAPGQGCVVTDGPTSGYDSCVAGSMCAGVDDMGIGICILLCAGTEQSPSCPGGLECVSFNDGAINQCVQICDPLLDGDCAQSTDICVPYVDTFVCVEDASGGGAQDYMDCEYINECGDGRFCGDGLLAPSLCTGGMVGCCLPLCSLVVDPSGCVEPTLCQPFFPEGEAPPKYAGLGYCGEA